MSYLVFLAENLIHLPHEVAGVASVFYLVFLIHLPDEVAGVAYRSVDKCTVTNLFYKHARTPRGNHGRINFAATHVGRVPQPARRSAARPDPQSASSLFAPRTKRDVREATPDGNGVPHTNRLTTRRRHARHRTILFYKHARTPRGNHGRINFAATHVGRVPQPARRSAARPDPQSASSLFAPRTKRDVREATPDGTCATHKSFNHTP